MAESGICSRPPRSCQGQRRKEASSPSICPPGPLGQEGQDPVSAADPGPLVAERMALEAGAAVRVGSADPQECSGRAWELLGEEGSGLAKSRCQY